MILSRKWCEIAPALLIALMCARISDGLNDAPARSLQEANTFDSSCEDDPDFRDTKNGFSCFQLGTIGCDRLGVYEYSEKDARDIIGNCTKSCDTCTGLDGQEITLRGLPTVPIEVLEFEGYRSGEICTSDEYCASGRCNFSTGSTNLYDMISPLFFGKFKRQTSGVCECQVCDELGCGGCAHWQICEDIPKRIFRKKELNKCVTVRATSTNANGASLTNLIDEAFISSCRDTPLYRNSKHGFTCIQFKGMVCDELGVFGYNENEKKDVKDNCKMSCGTCWHSVEAGISLKNSKSAPTDRVESVPTDIPTKATTDSPKKARVGRNHIRKNRQTNEPTDSYPTEVPTNSPTNGQTAKATPAPTEFFATGVQEMYAACGVAASCQTGSCFLGMYGTATVGQCQCRVCNSDGCGGCSSGRNCKTFNSRVANQCVPYVANLNVESPPTKSPLFTIPQLGHVCTSDQSCASGSCFRGRYGNTRYGTCQCSDGDDGGCEGGICELISTSEPTKCRSVPIDGLCFSDDDCRNKSCYLGAEGTDERGRCTCRQCRRPGCGGCKDTQTCPESSDLISRKCVDITVQPPSNTPMDSNAPSKLLSGKSSSILSTQPSSSLTVYIPFTVPLGGYCSKHVDCMSRSCFEKFEKCQCRFCGDTPGCKDGCGPLSTCKLRNNSLNFCKAIPTEELTVAPTSSPTVFTPFTVPLGGYCDKNNACMSRSCFQKICQCQVCDTSGCDSGCEPTEICRLRTNSVTICRERPTRTLLASTNPTV